jgi:hypothetical protein
VGNWAFQNELNKSISVGHTICNFLNIARSNIQSLASLVALDSLSASILSTPAK